MESNFENTLKSLQEKFKYEDTTFDSLDMEKCLREFKTELYIKRDQVKQLRTDLEISTAEIIELRKVLDSTTQALDERNFNLKVITKKFRSTEDELLEKNDLLNTIQMQHKLTVAEVEKIKEHLQLKEAEKLELTRKLEVFETKQRQSFIYHNQILKRETNLKNTTEEVEEIVNKLNLELSNVAELSKKSKIAEESLEKCQQLTSSFEKIKKEKDSFEELYIRTKAQYEMLQQLLSLNEDIQEPNLMNNIIFDQWKSSRTFYDEQMQKNNDILNKLTERYNNEKTTNVQLIKKNAQISEENQNLKAEIEHLKDLLKKDVEKQQKVTELGQKTMENNNTQEKVKIKEELIEILD